jgi:hypothetical protein
MNGREAPSTVPAASDQDGAGQHRNTASGAIQRR